MTTTLAPSTRKHRERHDAEEIQAGLIEMALAAGSARIASRRLAERNIKIARRTLENWVDCYAPQYEKACTQVAPEIQRRLAAQHEQYAQRALQVGEKALDLLEKQLPTLPPREISNALRNIQTTVGISSDKLTILRERPAQVHHEHRSLEANWRALEALGVVQQIEPGAPVTDAEVVEVNKTEGDVH